MILVTGGAFQGKKDFILNEKNIHSNSVIDFEELLSNDEFNRMLIVRKAESSFLYSYIKESLSNSLDYCVLYHCECLVRFYMDNQFDVRHVYQLIDDLSHSDGPQFIIISDNISNCLVPVDKKDRLYREELSRIICYVSKQSNEVFRVFVGIGEKLK